MFVEAKIARCTPHTSLIVWTDNITVQAVLLVSWRAVDYFNHLAYRGRRPYPGRHAVVRGARVGCVAVGLSERVSWTDAVLLALKDRV